MNSRWLCEGSAATTATQAMNWTFMDTQIPHDHR